MHPTDINEKIFSHFIADKIIFFYNNIVQQHFWHKYSLWKVPNQIEKLREIPGGGGRGGWQAPLERKFQRDGRSTSFSALRGGEGRGENVYFLELHISGLHLASHYV